MELIKNNNRGTGLKLNKWIILSSLCLVLFLNSCAQMKSVRHNGGPYVVKRGNGENLIMDEENDINSPEKEQNREILAKLEEFREMAEKQQAGQSLNPDREILASSENLPMKSSRRKLPTLREQMREIADKQAAMVSRLDDIETDISDIRGDIASINRKLDVFVEKDAGAIAGVQQRNSSNNPIEQTFFPDADIILPDEMEKPAPRKQSKPQKKAAVISTNTSQEKSVAAEAIADKEKPVDNSLNEIEKILEKKDYNKALNLLNSELKKSKSPSVTVNCYFWMGESYFGLEQYDDAIEYYQKVIKSAVNTHKPKARIMIAESLIRTGRVNEAKDEYSTLIKDFPSSEFVPDARKMLQKL